MQLRREGNSLPSPQKINFSFLASACNKWKIMMMIISIPGNKFSLNRYIFFGRYSITTSTCAMRHNFFAVFFSVLWNDSDKCGKAKFLLLHYLLAYVSVKFSLEILRNQLLLETFLTFTHGRDNVKILILMMSLTFYNKKIAIIY